MIIFRKSLQTAIVGLCSLSLLGTLLAGCAGNTPHPIPQQQPGDETLNCSQIKYQLTTNQTKIMDLIPKENKTGKNVALGVAGAFLIVPWFFMDFSDAERVEVQGYQLRNDYLSTLADKKHCTNMPVPLKFAG